MVAKARFLVFLFVCLSFTLNAATEKFYNVNTLFGISLREMNSVCSDNNGFIWASSKAGVLRLTEDNYKIYSLPYQNTNVLTVSLVVENQRLVAYTNNGQIFIYNPVYDRFDLLIDLYEILGSRYLNVYNLLVDEAGACWIASTAGFYRYEANKATLVRNDFTERYIISWYDKRQIVMAGTTGVALFDVRTMKLTPVSDNLPTSPFSVMSLFFDPLSSKLFIGTMSDGVFVYDFKAKSFAALLESTLPKQPVLSITKKSNANLLFGVDGQGIWEYSAALNKVVNVFKESVDDPSSLRGNGVYDIFCDRNDRVWVCTYSGGLSFFDQATPLVSQIVHRTNNVNSLVNNDVNCVVEDRYGKLWMGTNNGISCWDVKSNQWKHFYSDDPKQAQVFLALCEDGNGRIWAGSYSSGLFVIDAKTGAEIAHYGHSDKRSPLFGTYIMDIYKDSDGDLWIGGVNGNFVCYLAKENKFRAYTKEPVSRFAEVEPNNFLVGCSFGLLSLNKQTGQTKLLLIGFSVRDILVTGDVAWLCTNGDGLIKYDYKTNDTLRYNTQSGLPSNFVNSITLADNYFWIGTESGLCRFNPKDNSFHSYSYLYQLSRSSFNSKSFSKLNNGTLVWGTNNGAIMFDPGALREMKPKGDIFFEDFLVSGRSIREMPKMELSSTVNNMTAISLEYYQNTFGIELLPINTTAGAKFSWKLEGFDKQWTMPSDNRMVTYTNVPDRNFVLRVKLFDNALSQVLAERSIEIKVVPPFWKSYWFWGLIYVFLIALALLVLQYYLRSIRQKHAEEKVRFFTNTSHEIRTSLTLIKAPIEELGKETNLSDTGKYYLHLAVEQARRLSAVVTQLMDFQKVDVGKEQMSYATVDVVKFVSTRLSMFESLAKIKEVELTFHTNLNSYITAIDEAKMEKVIDNLVSNAVKYSKPNGKVEVQVRGDAKRWQLTVKDEGIGIGKSAQRRLFKEFYRAENAINSKVVGSGIGLLLVKNYVDMHNGSITCSSQENVGSVFSLEIPFLGLVAEPDPENRFSFTDSTIMPAIDVVPHHAAGTDDDAEAGMKVLVVEDNDELLSFMKRVLSVDFDVFTAENGKQAMAFIEHQMPDIVISDIMMPEMDGFELCERLKSAYDTSHIPVVLLTALSEKTEQMKGLGLGADDYLTKPFDMTLLVQKIKTIVKNRSAVREKSLKLFRATDDEPIVSNALNDKFMKRMMEVAKENLSNSEFNKDEFASAMNVSSSLLYKKIKSLTNLSPTDYIKLVRLDHSLELLRSRQYTVTEVSELCGFASVGYFSTVFRKHFGKSPTEILD